MSLTSVIAPLLVGIAINEFCDVSPWIACKIVRWSARRKYTDPQRAEIRAEELAALIDDRPGNLLKLLTAFGYAGSAIGTVSMRRASGVVSRTAAKMVGFRPTIQRRKVYAFAASLQSGTGLGMGMSHVTAAEWGLYWLGLLVTFLITVICWRLTEEHRTPRRYVRGHYRRGVADVRYVRGYARR